MAFVALAHSSINATFNYVSVILWQSVLLMGETGVPTESHWQTLSDNVVSGTPHSLLKCYINILRI